MKVFGISVAACTLESATDAIIGFAQKSKAGLIVTPNVDVVITLKKAPLFLAIYQRALLVTADGMPLVWLSKILPGNSLPERVTGADLLVAVCKGAAKYQLSVAFIGGPPGDAEIARDNMVEQFSDLQVLFVHCPPLGFEENEEQSHDIVALCQRHKPDIVFFGVGAPKQEKWCDKYLEEMGVGPILCVGSAISFAAGSTIRAPLWMQTSGLEWLFRLSQDPGHLWKRYILRDPLFIYYALHEFISAWQKRLF